MNRTQTERMREEWKKYKGERESRGKRSDLKEQRKDDRRIGKNIVHFLEWDENVQRSCSSAVSLIIIMIIVFETLYYSKIQNHRHQKDILARMKENVSFTIDTWSHISRRFFLQILFLFLLKSTEIQLVSREIAQRFCKEILSGREAKDFSLFCYFL